MHKVTRTQMGKANTHMFYMIELHGKFVIRTDDL